MTEPDGRTPHPTEPAEGATRPGESTADERGPHPEAPAEGPDDETAVPQGREQG